MFLKGTKKLPVAMRLGETPVPIPNTMVKTQEADGTMLETAWESRWLPGSLKNLLVDFEGTKQVWQYGSGRCTLKTAHRKFFLKEKRHQISMIRKN